MNSKQPGLIEIGLVLRSRLDAIVAKEFIKIGRHTAGEVCIPKGAEITKISVYSGPLLADRFEAFSPLHNSAGEPVVIEVSQGANFELPAPCFACHQIALVADVQTAATLRLRG